MITMDVFVIVIVKKSTGEPVLYYNHVEKKWVENFERGCGFSEEIDAVNIMNELDVKGADVLKGKGTLE